MDGWKDIEGYEGIYQAHPTGKLQSLDRTREFTGGNQKGKFSYTRFSRGVVLTGGADKNGYRIGVFHDSKGVRRTLKFHRLVAQTFISNPDNLPQVNHKDGNKANNHVDNLEWVTGSKNVQHTVITGLRTSDHMKIPVVQLDKDTLEVVKVYESAQAAANNGFNRGHVGGCCRGDRGRKVHKGYRWKFLHDFEGPTTIPTGSTLQANGSGSGEHPKG